MTDPTTPPMRNPVNAPRPIHPEPGTPQVTRHPLRGAAAGLIAGIGVAVLLISFSVIAFGTRAPIVVIVAGGVLGIAMGLLPPPLGRKPGDAPPPYVAAPTPGAPAAPQPPPEPAEPLD